MGPDGGSIEKPLPLPAGVLLLLGPGPTPLPGLLLLAVGPLPLKASGARAWGTRRCFMCSRMCLNRKSPKLACRGNSSKHDTVMTRS